MKFSAMLKQRGVTTIEYAMLAAGLAVVIGALLNSDSGTFTEILNNLFDGIKDKVNAGSGSGAGGK